MGHPHTPYNPTSKYLQKSNLHYKVLITIMCSIFYLLGLFQHHYGPTSKTGPTLTNINQIRCLTHENTPFGNSKTLNISSYHAADPQVHTWPVKSFPPCDVKYSDYTPCQDTERSRKFEMVRFFHKERHCPDQAELLKCRVPAPYGYRNPFPWPESRDYAWYANVPHKHLTVLKKGQNWVRFEGDRFRFPGGGTQFRHGADKYIDEIGKLINLDDGSIRTAIDTGCGVASWGAYLLSSRNILPVSFAPVDSHEAQVQFALERGVPALIDIMGTKRLPYPSRAFDMAHCSRCLISWGQYDGQYLIEIDRILRPGGYWILSGPPISWKKNWKAWERTKEDLNLEQITIESVAKSLCWEKLGEKSDIAIWQKPINRINCKIDVKMIENPFCQAQDPDKAWYTKLETCLNPMPDVSDIKETAGGKLAKWPERLTETPPRILSGSVEGVTEEMFQLDTELWTKSIAYYKSLNNELGQKGRYRNVLDMNAHLGGFAAALIDDPLWVMNVVPTEAKINTLGVIFERGLIGTYQNWCEAMSTYPRTYDFIHANSVFSLYKDRCEMEDILLEMDRILRPEGAVIFRDNVDVLLKIRSITDGLKWRSTIAEHEDIHHNREKLLVAVKLYWTAPAPADESNRVS